MSKSSYKTVELEDYGLDKDHALPRETQEFD